MLHSWARRDSQIVRDAESRYLVFWLFASGSSGVLKMGGAATSCLATVFSDVTGVATVEAEVVGSAAIAFSGVEFSILSKFVGDVGARFGGWCGG